MDDLKKITKVDIQWVFTLFGTAIGAGLLYLPIQAGKSGIWAIITVMIFALPLTYLSHRNMSRIVLKSKNHEDITDTFSDTLGYILGTICVLLYFLAIYLNMPLYAIGLNNEISNFLYEKGITNVNLSNHIWFSFLLLFFIFMLVSFGIKIILRVMQLIVIVLILLVIFLSIYMIPYWNISYLDFGDFDFRSYLRGILMVLPILVLALNHSPVISSLVIFYRDRVGLNYPNNEDKVNQIMKISSLSLFIFVLIFVTSCLLSVPEQDIINGAANNLSIVTILGKYHDSQILDFLGPMIVLTAIVSSFVGCYIGSKEGLHCLLNTFLNKFLNLRISGRLINRLATFLIFLTLWISVICNFSILDIIGLLVAPAVAFLLYLLPVIIIYKNTKYKNYRYTVLNAFLTVMGLTIIVGYFFGLTVL
ncbi:amino acid permease [Pseudofrancisella aestuarii]|uniref:Amino acid permease n=1 Tax=Pseudofrancisella aestuarii TaxID=2670347 RepID=A0ABV9TCT4_9GAMM|nr:amino acid permease [Pseudofrancisella aestuarii]